jgi:hypothetical protein
MTHLAIGFGFREEEDYQERVVLLNYFRKQLRAPNPSPGYSLERWLAYCHERIRRLRAEQFRSRWPLRLAEQAIRDLVRIEFGTGWLAIGLAQLPYKEDAITILDRVRIAEAWQRRGTP